MCLQGTSNPGAFSPPPPLPIEQLGPAMVESSLTTGEVMEKYHLVAQKVRVMSLQNYLYTSKICTPCVTISTYSTFCIGFQFSFCPEFWTVSLSSQVFSKIVIFRLMDLLVSQFKDVSHNTGV